MTSSARKGRSRANIWFFSFMGRGMASGVDALKRSAPQPRNSLRSAPLLLLRASNSPRGRNYKPPHKSSATTFCRAPRRKTALGVRIIHTAQMPKRGR
ncbi:hypothetical protein KCP73_17880 [Salmonella enterica subsp. enterica]|nr:hypothetical protein KCP73_17880 [Salmonella enterica subsp. enterica]